MTKKERYKYLLEHFEKNYPEPETELNYKNPYQLLVSVILSAQCTDKRVNIVTPPLFKEFPTAKHLAQAHVDDVYPFVKSISYPNNKTRHLIGMAKMLTDNFKGVVPNDIKEMQRLPGVGRKTANVILSVIYNQPAMAVDTHVNRVSKRLGLVSEKATTPLAVERELVKYIQERLIPKAHHWLILHGRYTCRARNPKCENCELTSFCLYYNKIK